MPRPDPAGPVMPERRRRDVNTDTDLDTPGTRFLTAADAWNPPAPSLATRHFARRSPTSGRATLVCPLNDRELKCESLLEAKCAAIILARPDVVLLEEQPAAVQYRDTDGRIRSHRFDFRVTTNDGTRTALQVKTHERAERLRWRTLIAEIGRQVGPRFADSYRVVTERNLPTCAVHNAAQLLSARRGARADHDAQIRGLAATLHGAIAIADLVTASGLDGDGFRAVVRLIGAGDLVVNGHGRITPTTLVSVPAATEGA
jgi:hypothetical protein